MWTHLQPYLPNDRRAETIRRKARIGLWRAINMRRLILLVGSGATISLGQQSWNQTLIHFIALTTQQFAQNGMASHDEERNEDGSPTFTRFPVRQIRLFDQIMELCGTEDVKHYSLGSPDEAKAQISEKLAELEAQDDLDTDALRIALDLCEELLNVMDEGEPQPKHVAKVRAAFAESFHSKDGAWENLDADKNPVGRILKHTRSRRVLTTNYDAEFERFLYESNLRSEPGTTAHLQFKRLPKFDAQIVDASPRRISVSSSLRQKISSTSIDAGNVGDLVNFAAYSRSELYQIFHLHGRLDHPMDMVVSKSDYRRVYAQDPSSAEAFQAAQEILFSGNDVLMVGFGGETDILLPFRRFVERGRKADQAPSRTFALLPSDTGNDYKRKNATKSIDWALDYEIYTIHYGGKRFRETLGALKAIRKTLSEAWKNRTAHTLDPLDVQDALKRIGKFRVRRPDDAKTDSRGEKELVSQKTFDDLNALATDSKKSTSVGSDREAWLAELRELRNAAETQNLAVSNVRTHGAQELNTDLAAFWRGDLKIASTNTPGWWDKNHAQVNIEPPVIFNLESDRSALVRLEKDYEDVAASVASAELQIEVVLVEGFFDALRLHRLGVPAVLLMGTSVSDEQVALLGELGVTRAVVLFDGDDEGQAAVPDVVAALSRAMFVRTGTLTVGDDPASAPAMGSPFVNMT